MVVKCDPDLNQSSRFHDHFMAKCGSRYLLLAKVNFNLLRIGHL